MSLLILASSSPRRKNILNSLQISFKVVVPPYEEVIQTLLSPIQQVQEFAYQKALSVATQDVYQNYFVLGADTLIEINEQILGKPKDQADAKRILNLLSGQSHLVHTALCLIHKNKNIFLKGVETTKVSFKKLKHSEIENYIQSDEPYDKAGAYAIQGEAKKFIEKIEGNLDTVIGFSSALFFKWWEEIKENKAKLLIN